MKENKVIKYIKEYEEENGFPPGYRVIAKHFGVSLYQVQKYMEQLKKAGIIQTIPGRGYLLKGSDQ